MIVTLNGILTEKKPHRIVIDVAGVGYEVGISTKTYSELPPEGKTALLRIYHHITESEQRLFGFTDQNDKIVFELLITVKGIGPRLALTIMSGMQTNDLIQAVSSQDTAYLARTPGIGKKTAERVVLELRDKLGGQALSGGASLPKGSSGPQQESVSALEALGFKRIDAENAVSKVLKDTPEIKETGDLVRASLKHLYR
jgi:holliday junction DNA helicase RuvA